MLIVSYLGRFFIVLALFLLGLFLWLWLSAEDITRSGGQIWFSLHNGSLNYFQVVLQRHLGLPGLWDNFVVPVMLQPPAWKALVGGFIALMLSGGLLVFLSLRRETRYSFRK